MRLSRTKWKRVAACIVLGGLMAYTAMGFVRADEEIITYEKEVRTGDTLWGIVSKVAPDKEDVCKLTWQVMQDNNIKDPGNLQPGQVIIIRVKKARDL